MTDQYDCDANHSVAPIVQGSRYKVRGFLATVFGVFGFGILAFGIWHFVERASTAETPEKLNEWGDFIGGTLGAAGAVAGSFFVMSTLIYQSVELALQRDELAKALDVYKQQEKHQRESAREAAEQTQCARESLALTRRQTVMSHVLEMLPRISETMAELDPAEIRAASSTIDEIEIEIAEAERDQLMSELRSPFCTLNMLIAKSLTQERELRILFEFHQLFIRLMRQSDISDEIPENLSALVSAMSVPYHEIKPLLELTRQSRDRAITVRGKIDDYFLR